MTNEQIIRKNMEAAIVAWVEEERSFRGDRFATEHDLENIKIEPLGFADLLQGEDAYKFVRRCLDIARDAQEKIDFPEDFAK
jgi:hypothetical protein